MRLRWRGQLRRNRPTVAGLSDSFAAHQRGWADDYKALDDSEESNADEQERKPCCGMAPGRRILRVDAGQPPGFAESEAAEEHLAEGEHVARLESFERRIGRKRLDGILLQERRDERE